MAEAELSEFKDVFSLIDKMYKILTEARSGFMDQDLVKVSRSSLENLLDELRQGLPTQLKSAVELMRKADEEMSRARNEAEEKKRKAEAYAAKIVADAQRKAEYISGNDNIVMLASQKADSIVADAQRKSAKIVADAQRKAVNLKAASEQWSLDNLQNFMETLKKLVAVTQGGVENIRNRQKQNLDKRNGGE